MFDGRRHKKQSQKQQEVAAHKTGKQHNEKEQLRGSSSSFHDTDKSCGTRVRSCSEVGQVGDSLLDVGVSRGQAFEECHRQDTGACGSWSSRKAVGRVPAAHGQGGQAFGDCQASSGRSCRAGSFSSNVQHRVCKIGGVEEGGIGDPAPDGGGLQHGQNPTTRAMVSELRRKKDDLRSHIATSSERARLWHLTILIPEALEELPQWIMSTSARMSMAMEREEFGVGGRVGSRGGEVGQREAPGGSTSKA